MTPEKWQRIKHVLEASLELPAGERAAYLERTCADEPDLRAEVESLIASYEAAGDLLEAPAIAGQGAVLVAERLDEAPVGRRIGHYRIEEEIGRGGMGAVYRAVRADGHFKSQVAIKLIKRDIGDEALIRRFRNERQIMASLEHPNIARLLDGGSTDDGLPYFVMEYIEGRPIDRCCDEERLTIRERLELFRQVCSAVQYAHDQLVVHRDIKPGNILITAEGSPKLLDFGIAKIFNPELSTRTYNPTATAMRLMTPEYASPEQVLGEAVTVASDIYSLGVLLYQLITGHRPYRLKTAAPHELAKAICDIDPEKPSTVVRRTEPAAGLTPEAIARARSTQPDRLRRIVSGDLDNIILMAMRKEPQRRYASVEQFSEDIRRFLEGFPISARKDTLLYRTSKFIARNRAAVALVLATAIGSFGVYTLMEQRPAAQASNIVPFTSMPGEETQPAFSPDGKQIAFVWNGDGDNQDIYVRSLDQRDLRRLTTNTAQDNSPAWSPDGRYIAWLRSSSRETALFVSPARGGVHRKVADVWPTRIETAGRPMHWSPNGKYLAIGDRVAPDEPFSIFLIEVESGARTRLTYPPARTIGDSGPAFSPDGRQISFIRALSSGVSELCVMSLDGGGVRQLTNDNREVSSQVWTRDSRYIVFTSSRKASSYVWRVSPSGGEPERFPGLGMYASDPSFSKDGRLMAYTQSVLDTNVWRIAASGEGKPRKLLVSTQYDSSPQYSPDGSRIAFRSSRSGAHEVWIADSEGLSSEQLTHFDGPLTGTPRWSPDGDWICFDSRPEGKADIFVISSHGGKPRNLTNDPAEDVVASWSHDGKWIYFASNRTGSWQVWKIPAPGGRAEQVTYYGGFAAFESPDGKYLYYAKGRSTAGLWRLAAGTRREEPVLERLRPGFWGYWAVVPNGIYYVDENPEATDRGIYFHDFASQTDRRIAPLERRPIPGDSALAVSPDRRYILYTQIDQSGSDIMLADYGR